MVATVETQPRLLYSDDLTPEQAKKTLPVMHCRDCGATGWGGVKPSQGATKLVANDLQRFYREYFGRKPLVTFAFPAHDATDTHITHRKLGSSMRNAACSTLPQHERRNKS